MEEAPNDDVDTDGRGQEEQTGTKDREPKRNINDSSDNKQGSGAAKESISFEGNQECLETIEVGAFYLSVQKEKKQSWADMVEEDEEKANSAPPMLNPIKTLSRSPVPAPRGVTDLDASDDSVAAEAFISAERERRAAEASHMKADVGVAVDSKMKNHGRAETCRHGSEDVSTAAYPGRVGSGEKSNSFMGGKPHATEGNVFKPSKAEVITFGGIKEASAAGVRTSGRLCAQPNADATQMERAQHLAQRHNDFMSSGYPTRCALDPTLVSFATSGPAGTDAYWMQQPFNGGTGFLFAGYWMAAY